MEEARWEEEDKGRRERCEGTESAIQAKAVAEKEGADGTATVYEGLGAGKEDDGVIR